MELNGEVLEKLKSSKNLGGTIVINGGESNQDDVRDVSNQVKTRA